MALTLTCVCPGAKAKICHVTQLVWNAAAGSALVGGEVGAFTEYQLVHPGAGGGGPIIFGDGSGAFPLSLEAWMPVWDAMYTRLYIDASTFQVPSPPGSSYKQTEGTCWIDIHYACVDTITGETITRVVESRPILAGFQQCETAPGDIRSKCFGGSTSKVILYKSTPLGACNGCTAITADFEPPPENNQLDVSSNACLCATGGSGDYEYSIISGNLPSGQTLNTTTGCIEGDPDGKVPGSTNITYQVLDKGGAGVPPTGGDTTTGKANVFGSGATKTSGPDWDDTMVGQTMTFGGSTGTVAAVTDASHLTLESPLGIIPGATWSYTSPVVPPPPAGPPDSAQVTCGYQGGGCAGSGGPQIGNVSY